MSKTSKTEFRNKENDLRKGKIAYQERLVDEQIAEEEIKNYVAESTDYEDIFEDVKNKLR
jgi:hypothetical protein